MRPLDNLNLTQGQVTVSIRANSVSLKYTGQQSTNEVMCNYEGYFISRKTIN